LDQITVKRLAERLQELALEPYSTRISKAVKMEPGQRTSRVGDWRIIYRVDENNQEIKVIAFRPRGKAYR
jgi:mRNA interferase RelE/StbE